jgi:hypothetical protein
VLGPNITLAQVAARLRCSRCGMRGARMEARYRVRPERGGSGVQGCGWDLLRRLVVAACWANATTTRASTSAATW